MKYFLIIFDRVRGRVLLEKEFTDRLAALHERFRAERVHAGSAEIEVVVLGAESPAALRRTHARYFETVGEIARSGAAKLAG